MKTWNDNYTPTCSGQITVKNWRNLPISNHKPDLPYINAHTKFDIYWSYHQEMKVWTDRCMIDSNRDTSMTNVKP